MKLLLGIAIGWLLVSQNQAWAEPLLPDDAALYDAAFAAAEAGRWERADSLAAKGAYPSLRRLLSWMRLSEARPLSQFAEFAAFIGANPDWPGMDNLRRRAEVAMGDAMDPDRVIRWFTDHPPLSGVGKMRAAEAHRAKGDQATAARLFRDAWINGNFSAAEEKTFYIRHHHPWLTAEDHIARLDRLLWDGKRSAARRMLRRVDAGSRALGEARLALRASAGGVDGAIARVPAALRDHPGLWYERLRWRRRKGFRDGAREILDALPDELMRPALWWREAKFETRKAIQTGLVSTAYAYAADHRQVEALPRSEAEWLAGWIALRFLGDAGLASQHFAALYSGVRYPISLTRGAYWSGRAAAAKDPASARQWFETAGRHPTTFYGQLALAELGGRGLLELPADPVVSDGDRAALAGRELATVTRALARVGPSAMLRRFVRRLTDLAETPGQRRLVAEIAADANRPEVGVLAARRAARQGTTLIEFGYPLVAFPPRPGGIRVDEALLLAMLRQESGFSQTARSGAGALGLMQLMPATARVVARRLGLPYDKARLTQDRDYNLSLGRAYMADLLDTYDGSYVLALAAYNGGERRVRFWIKTYGDPRDRQIDVIDWIESIPITETRNYVQRVMEAVAVYRLRLGRPVPAHSLLLDLERGLR